VLWSTLAGLLVLAALAPIFLARLLGIGYDTPGPRELVVPALARPAPATGRGLSCAP
jgi:hypothetical protein